MQGSLRTANLVQRYIQLLYNIQHISIQYDNKCIYALYLLHKRRKLHAVSLRITTSPRMHATAMMTRPDYLVPLLY